MLSASIFTVAIEKYSWFAGLSFLTRLIKRQSFVNEELMAMFLHHTLLTLLKMGWELLPLPKVLRFLSLCPLCVCEQNNSKT